MGRRLVMLLIVLVIVGAPAAALRASCAGASCRSSAAPSAPAPFCSLPADLRALITAGTYDDGRSPDVLGVTNGSRLVSVVDSWHGIPIRVPWPSTTLGAQDLSVPLWMIGQGVRKGTLPADVGLDQIAPTLEPLVGLRRPHPEVRSGTAIHGVADGGATSKLVVVIVWKGVGTRDVTRSGTPALDRWVVSSGGSRGVGVARGDAATGSVPVDPIAVEATIGTGALPSQHGVTGTWLRGADGKVTFAFGDGSPQPVVAAFGDDLDRWSNHATKIGLIQQQVGDRALTGDRWYGTGPVIDRIERSGDLPSQVDRFLRDGWGADVTPDLLAVPMLGSVRNDDRTSATLIDEIERRVPSATIVVAGTGWLQRPAPATAAALPGTVDAPRAGDVAGGYFLDRTAGAAASASTVVDAMDAEGAPDGSPLYADAFASYAVRFGRYC